ncbi:hypothetical protein GH984_03690 [Spiribacter sp. C176]|uniref:Uncharacterized protein n=1 Tax=Spiribacter salilacus TaxID=2664894 RepID=A0A6N7QRM6_9GAMM|nr:hypothetical protein [Spiribacter salilacus]MRH77798.1 hypothetical protein [Spiribacter salilacus]
MTDKYQNVVTMAQRVAHHDARNLFSTFPQAITTIIERRLWADRTDKNGQPFTSFQSFVEHRMWQGLELTMPRLIRYCEDDEEAVRLIKGEMQQAGNRGNPTGANQYTPADERKADNIRFPNSYGTSVGHTVARLKRDRPDLAKEVIDGTMSPNAAAIEAGFRKRKVQVEPTPEAVQRMLDKYLPGFSLVYKTGGA